MTDAERPMLLEHAGHACECGPDDGGDPVLDARQIPHALRHGAVLGAWAAVRPGEAMILVAPHDPVPLLAKMAHRDPDVIGVEYLERGPQAWRLRVSRAADPG
ncbi:MAG: DUF2249 domain-containing protein [Austwickia sp.]|jgi:uncharacterized protein (DUF2249 family)|nr:DUF2249 domain-containing protein [Austwickia sp.]MBK8437265.1 DUF2249 domain-containing protein [Austwickia sp.]